MLRVCALTAAVAATATLASAAADNSIMDNSRFVVEWRSFKTKFSKSYTTPSEEASRFTIFCENMRRAELLQARNPDAKFGATIFSDLSAAEFKATHHNLNTRKKRPDASNNKNVKKNFPASIPDVKSMPQKWDWREHGGVTPVKNQAQCGSCWAFSTTEAIESAWMLAGHRELILSPQEIVSCDPNDDGCDGGDPGSALRWLLSSRNGTLLTEAEYPYISGGGDTHSCRMPSTRTNFAQITGYHDVPGHESQMAAYLSQLEGKGGPLSICVDASTWQNYQGGVMNYCPSSGIDHCVQLVGYDLTASTPYWSIRNSWADSWGEDGYLRVQYGQDACGLTSEPRWPIVPNVGPTSPPGPTPPPTPSPPTQPPTPAPPLQNATQYWCPDKPCDLSQCTKHVFPQRKCLTNPDGQYVMVICQPNMWVLKIYQSQSGCTGDSYEQRQQLRTCFSDDDGTYLYNECPIGDALTSSGDAADSSDKPILVDSPMLNAAIKRAKKDMAKLKMI